jgi:DNA-binding transcriptional MerR regulator
VPNALETTPSSSTILPLRRAGKSPAAFRTISEVADDLEVPQHVLRFWETKFPQIRPLKRGGGRRYYRPEDIDLLRRVSGLLYKEGYTIKGVQRLLREGSLKSATLRPELTTTSQLSLEALEVASKSRPTDATDSRPATAPAVPTDPETRATLTTILDDLLQLKESLKRVRD